MDDLSKLSDSELTALYKGGQTSAAAPTDVGKMSDDQLLAAYNANKAKPAPISAAQDFTNETAKGLGRGFAGAVGDVGQAIAGPFGPTHHFGNLMADLGLGERPQTEPEYGQRITKAVGGLEASPQTGWGKAGGTVGEFVGNPESYLGPGGMLAKAATAAGAGLGSEAAGGIAEKFAPDSPKVQAATRLIGAIAGGHGVGVVPRAVTPNIIAPERQAMVNTLAHEGIPLTAGDRTGGTMLKAAESELSPGANDAQRRAFEQAAFNRVGERIGDRPIQGQTGAVNTMMRRIGGQFDGLVSRNNVAADPQLVNDLRDVHSTYNDVPGLYPQETVNSVNGSIDRVMNSMFNRNGPGSLSGADYQTLRSNLRRAAQGATDPQRAEGLHDVVNSLDDAMERTIQRTNPQDAGAWARARRDYQNGLVLERWAGSANMTPATLAQAAKAVYGKRQYVRGMDDFSELAEAGRNIMKQYQDSGTPRRLQIENALKGVGGLVGAGAGAAHGDLANAAEGGVFGLLLGELAGPLAARPAARAGLMNPVTQGYLSNQATPYRLGSSPTMEALVNEIKGQPQVSGKKDNAKLRKPELVNAIRGQ